MIYKAVEVIWIFSADGRDGRDGTGIEGTIRGPRGPKKNFQPLNYRRDGFKSYRIWQISAVFDCV